MNADADSSGKINLGPSKWAIPGITLHTPFFWIGVILALFSYWDRFRLWVWKITPTAYLQRELIEFYAWQKQLPVPLWLIAVGIGLAYALVRYGTSRYYIDGTGLLFVNTGMLGFGNPGGPLVNFSDSIAMSLVADVNVSRNPINMIFGTGTLVVTFIEFNRDGQGHKGSRTMRLTFIEDADSKRQLLMKDSHVHHARAII